MAKKKDTDLFGDDILLNQNRPSEFAALLDQPSLSPSALKVGDTLRGEILTIGRQEAFVSTGTAIDGALPIAEILDKDKKIKFKVGEVIEVRVVRVGDSEILLKRVGSTTGAANVDDLQDAFDLELPVEGKVTEIVKGGFIVLIMSHTAFCPVSQMDFKVLEPESYLGKRFEFLITQFDQSGRNLVVSRRRVLDMQKLEAEGEFLQKHKVGDLFEGKITRIEKFGAFVEIKDSIQGLIPISELAWNRVQDPHDVVSLGQAVQITLLSATEEEDGRLKISFSMKQAGDNPWVRVLNDFPVGKIFEGTVERREPYGLFVNLVPGITGLLPKSKWRDLAEFQNFDHKKKGDKIQIQIDEVKIEEKRISLGPPVEKDDLSWKSHASSGQGFGSLGDLLKQSKPKK